MNHKQKLRLARRMNNGKQSGAFQTQQWDDRKRGIASYVLKHQKFSSKDTTSV